MLNYNSNMPAANTASIPVICLRFIMSLFAWFIVLVVIILLLMPWKTNTTESSGHVGKKTTAFGEGDFISTSLADEVSIDNTFHK